MGIITHIVAFKYNSAVSDAERHLIASKFVALKDSCLTQNTKQPSILSLTGGANCSPEGFAKGFDHCFVLTFANKQDRDWYLDDDESHQQFKASLKDKIEDIFVFDYDVGVFDASASNA
ncbi:hypothetical protein OIO90_001882 [Microbotryomycetes sp. JL221]|nr:hypothetical protein OIO90_001882 [Microbotryomycetes sp. JL221]